MQKHFRYTARQFGAAIYAFDADVVLLAGKTTEFPAVSQTFQKYCHLPQNRFVTMWDYAMGNWCGLTTGNRIADSKYSTALGAVVYAVANYNFPIQNIDLEIRTRSAEGMNDGNCTWGVYKNGQYLRENTLIKPGHRRDAIEYSNKPILLARRRFDVDNTEAPVGYELRLKQQYRKMLSWKEQFEKELPGMKKHYRITMSGVRLGPGY